MEQTHDDHKLLSTFHNSNYEYNKKVLLSISVPTFFKYLYILSVCLCVYVHVSILIFKSWERCLSMYFHVPSAHLALVTAPVTCVWFCSIPAPIAPLWESRVMTECCCSSQDPGNMAVHFFAPGRRWPPADQFVISLHLCLQNDFCFLRRASKSQWQLHPDIYVILRKRLQKHWFMLCFCLPRMLAFSTITAGHNTVSTQECNYWFDLT